MEKIIRNVISMMVIVLMAVLTACNDSTHSAFNNGPAEEDFEPKSFTFVGEDKVDVLDAMDNVMKDGKNQEHFMELAAEPKYTRDGSESLVHPADMTQVVYGSSLIFTYNYDINNKLKVEGLTMEYIYKGQNYTLRCADKLEVRGEHRVVASEANPFREESETIYNLYAINQKTGKEILVATATQEFEILDGYVAPELEKSEFIGSEHKAFNHEAKLQNGELIVNGTNMATIHDIYSDGNVVPVNYDYALTHHFGATYSSEMVVDKLNEVVGKTFNGKDGKFVVADHTFIFNYIDCEVGKVEHNGTDYTDQLKKCRPQAMTLTILSSTQAKLCLYEDSESDCAEAILPITLKEKEVPVITLKGIDDVFAHLSYRAQAVANGNVLSVICDNRYTGTAKYSDGTEKQAALKDYTWTTRFGVKAPEMTLTAAQKTALYGRTINLVNGQATVEGYVVEVNFKDRKVSEIKYNFEDKAYDVTAKAPVCEATAKAIRFNADGTMTVFFEGEHGETIEGKVPVTINEKVEAIDLEGEIVAGYMTDSYWEHVSGNPDVYQHIITRLVDGSYKHYSRKEGEATFAVANLTAQQGNALIAQNRAFAFYRIGSSYVLGTVEAWLREGHTDRYLLAYYDMNGAVAHYLGKAEETIGSPFRYPVRSTLENVPGKGWTFNK